jgi:hypothetical protein
MTEGNDLRADRCERAISAYSADDGFTNLVDFLADAMHWAIAPGRISTSLLHKRAGITSTNSTINNKTKGD